MRRFMAQNEIFEEQVLDHAWGLHRGRHDHRRTVLNEERHRAA
jgi:hypothetical protein